MTAQHLTEYVLPAPCCMFRFQLQLPLENMCCAHLNSLFVLPAAWSTGRLVRVSLAHLLGAGHPLLPGQLRRLLRCLQGVLVDDGRPRRRWRYACSVAPAASISVLKRWPPVNGAKLTLHACRHDGIAAGTKGHVLCQILLPQAGQLCGSGTRRHQCTSWQNGGRASVRPSN